MRSKRATKSWTCESCGESHDGLAMLFGADAPAAWFKIPEDEREGEFNADMGYIDFAGERTAFLRGHIQLPVVDGTGEPFTWSVWVSLSEASMMALIERWDDPDRATIEPMFGWLASDLPYDVPPSPVPTMVHHRAPGLVPLIHVDPTLDHPLAREHVQGITMHRVAELNRLLLG